MAKVLEGIRVLDFGRFIAGPFGGTLLGDMGADVIRVERPGGEEDRTIGPLTVNDVGMRFIALARNKKCITLNLQSPQGREILAKLVKLSDVVLGNYPYGVMEDMGIDYKTLSKINPSIIVSQVSGFGQEGPYARRTCFDMIGQAMSGAISINGFPNNPPLKAQTPYVDYATATFSALGIMFALYHRERTGEGQMVDVSLFQTAVTYMLVPINEYMARGIVRKQVGNASYYTLSDTYRTKDGWVLIAVIGRYIWRRFAKTLGRPDLTDDPRFNSDPGRADNYDQLQPIIAKWMADKTTDEVMKLLEEARVPCGPVFDYTRLPDDPHVKYHKMLVDLDYPGAGKVPLHAPPIKLSKTPGQIRFRAPLLGEHNGEIYCGMLGYSRQDLETFSKEGII